MSKTINYKNERKKSNKYFLSLTINSILSMMVSYLFVYFTIHIYGEAVNGIMRFITQLFSYVGIVTTAMFMIFSSKIANFYGQQKWVHIRLINKYMKKFSYYFAIIYIIIILVVGLIISQILLVQNIQFLYIYLLFLAMACKPAFSLLMFTRYDIYLLSTNKGYIAAITGIVIQFILFAYVLLSMLLFPPSLVEITDKSTGTKIITFLASDKRAYNLIIAVFINSIAPLFSGIILSLILNKKKFDSHILHGKDVISNNEIQIVKKEIQKNIKYTILLGIASVVVSSTDEFVMLMLKTPSNENYILKMIGIYGIYISIFLTIKNLLMQYIYSKSALIGMSKNNSQQRNNIMKEIKSKIAIIASLFLVLTVIITPLISNILFNPTPNDYEYFNLKFSFPIVILFFVDFFFFPCYIEAQMDSRFKFLTILRITEAIINIVLSISLIKILGIYWVIWASLIATTIKIIIFEITNLMKNAKYKGIFQLSYNKKLLWVPLLLVIGIAEVIFSEYFNFRSDSFKISREQFNYLWLSFNILIFMSFCFYSFYISKFKSKAISNNK